LTNTKGKVKRPEAIPPTRMINNPIIVFAAIAQSLFLSSAGSIGRDREGRGGERMEREEERGQMEERVK
jgi:hypothetical protein